MFFRPAANRPQRFDQGAPEWRERVLDLGWNDRVDFSINQPVPFQAAQGLREHLLRNPADFALQFGVAPRPARQDVNDKRGPFVSDAAEDHARETMRVHHRRTLRAIGHAGSVTASTQTRNRRVTG
jgi:hypothetical protein